MVAEGGGECGTDNARTLCVLCHASVTAEQARARRGHKRSRQGGGGGGGGSGVGGYDEEEEEAEEEEEEGDGSPAKRLRGAAALRGKEGAENGGDGANMAPF
jgi:hypothetical protein